jgi:hypothetical protein
MKGTNTTQKIGMENMSRKMMDVEIFCGKTNPNKALGDCKLTIEATGVQWVSRAARKFRQ